MVQSIQTSNSSLANQISSYEERSLSSLIADIGSKIIHSNAVLYTSAVGIGAVVVSFVFLSNPIGWGVLAFAVSAIAMSVFFAIQPEEKPFIEVEAEIRPFLSQNQTIVKTKELREGFLSHMRLRDVKGDGNCFYSSLAVSLLEWVYKNRGNATFSLESFEKIVLHAKISNSMRKSVLDVIEKVKKSRNDIDIEDIVRADENIMPMISFFREMAAQELEADPESLQFMANDEKQAFSSQDPNFFWHWVISLFWKIEPPRVSNEEIIRHVRKSEDVESAGWAFPQSIYALMKRVPLPTLIWTNSSTGIPGQMQRRRIEKTDGTSFEKLPDTEAYKRALIVSEDLSRGSLAPASLFYTGGHYQVLYGLSRSEIGSHCIILN